MADDGVVTQWMVDQLVKPEHQYQDAVDLPLDSLRMAWPFKTDQELKAVAKWMRKQTKARHIIVDKMEEALL